MLDVSFRATLQHEEEGLSLLLECQPFGNVAVLENSVGYSEECELLRVINHANLIHHNLSRLLLRTNPLLNLRLKLLGNLDTHIIIKLVANSMRQLSTLLVVLVGLRHHTVH